MNYNDNYDNYDNDDNYDDDNRTLPPAAGADTTRTLYFFAGDTVTVGGRQFKVGFETNPASF
jgi:hypothetical protein